MLMAHPTVLRNLVEEYEVLTLLHGSARGAGPAVRQRRDDVCYTLCVATGTSDVDTALVAARWQLPGARPEDDSVVTDRPTHRR